MSRCTRFENEGLLQLERGEPLDPHFEECADCRAARTQYERLKHAIGQLDNDLQPSSDWQQRVVRKVEQGNAAQTNKTRWWTGGVALAASALFATWLLNANRTPNGVLTHELFESDVVYRGTTAKRGDRLRLNGRVEHVRHSELRLYRDDNVLVFACGDTPPCRNDGGVTIADVTLSAFGTYQAVLVMSDEAIPLATGQLDGDLLAAREAGGQVVVGDAVDVR